MDISYVDISYMEIYGYFIYGNAIYDHFICENFIYKLCEIEINYVKFKSGKISHFHLKK